MQWLMNIRDVMRQENKRNGLSNLALVLFGHSPLQHVDAERNHVHDVPFAATDGAVAIPLRRQHRDISVMKPVMRRPGRIRLMCRLVGAPEIAQLPVEVPVPRIMEGPWIVDTLFVPAL